MLAIGVVFVNGWTDAPGAIASSVCTGVLSMKRACLLSAVFNFCGVFLISAVNSAVSDKVSALAGFGKYSSAANCASFITVVVFGIACWYFAMPSSESHAMLSAVCGASLAVNRAADISAFLLVIAFMILSCVLSYAVSFWTCKCLKNAKFPYGKLQILSCILTSFMHGAQDGQKFIALMLFMPFFSTNHSITHTGVPFSLILTVSAIMSLGTLAGGGRIVNSLGADMVELDNRRGFISDICSAFCIFLFSLFGVPISTGNVKAASVIATGVADKKRVNKKTAACLAAVSVVTFPVCFALGYFLTDLFVNIGF